MRSKSELWNMKNRPIKLKNRLREAGKSHGWLAAEITKKGYRIARETLWGVINRQYQIKKGDPEKLKRIIEEVLTENRISIKGIWLYDNGSEQGMGKQPLKLYTHNNGEARNFHYSLNRREGMDMNYTKTYLDDEVLRHFGLKEDPFFDLIDFTDIWISPRLKVVERRVYDTIKRHGIMAIIGDIGAGKTTFLRFMLTKMLKEKAIKIIYPDRMDRRKLDGASLTQAVIRQLGGQSIPRNGIERDALAKRLLEDNVKMGTNPVLVLDEAHDLTVEAFIGLKRVWDSGMIFKLLSIILVGQGGVRSDNVSYGLLERLEINPFIREFAERCYVVDLGGLNGTMGQYLKYRFEKVGGDVNKIFTDKALHILAKKADVPQLANNIAIRAMQNTYRDGKTQVQPEHVAEA